MPLSELYCERCHRPFKTFLPLSEAKEGALCPLCGQRVFVPSLKVSSEGVQGGAVSCTLPQG